MATPPHRIHPLSFTYPRDFELCDLAVRSVRAWKRKDVASHILATDPAHPFRDEQCVHLHGALGCALIPRRGQFGNWDWSSAMTKIDFYREYIVDNPRIADDDYIMDHDDDVVFLNDRILNELDGSDFLGLPNATPIPQQRISTPVYHVSGLCMFIKKRALRALCGFPRQELDQLREQTRNWGMNHCFDTVISYLLHHRGCSMKPITGDLVHCGDIENALLHGQTNGYCAVHLMGPWKSFGGLPCAGKWGIPGILKQLGRDIW